MKSFKKLSYKWEWLDIITSPFKFPKISFYIGKISIGFPYFFPRKFVKFTEKEATDLALEEINNPNHYLFGKDLEMVKNIYLKSKVKKVDKNIGFDGTGLGWKDKWNTPRAEWSPRYGFCLFKYQIVVLFTHDNRVWESYLYYTHYTDKTKSKIDRLKDCKKEFPNVWVDNKENKTDYFKLGLKSKWINKLKL